MPSTELLSLSVQNQAPLRDGGTAGLRLAAPGTPNSPPALGCAPPHALWLPWERGARGTAGLCAGDLVLLLLAQVLPLCGAALG